MIACLVIQLMSTGRLDTSGLFGSTKAGSRKISLPADALKVRHNGIEFHASEPIANWTELSVDLTPPAHGRKIHGHGVVVACTGSRRGGYDISVLFMDLSKESQARLDNMAGLPRA